MNGAVCVLELHAGVACWSCEVNAYEFAVKFLFPRLSLVGQGGELRTDARAPRIDS